MNRLAASLVALTLAAGLASAVPAGAVPVGDAPGSSATGRSPSYTPPPLRFRRCTDRSLRAVGLRCATLVVPLDYRRPRGEKIRLAVSRLRHTSKRYQGVMLTNPGGPGGSGLGLAALGSGELIPGSGDTEYDWIGFDPRGVGSSRPALTCDRDRAGYDRPPYEPRTAAIERYWLRTSARYARDCRDARASRLLDHMKTTDNVRDMESLRKALGQRRINFFGYSYGTYLGQVYATLHPTRVRRFVLDGNVDPVRVWYRSNLDQDRAFERVMGAWFAYVARHADVYRLGRTAAAVEAQYYRQLRLLEARPAGGRLGPAELNDVLLRAGYSVYDWDGLASAFSDLVLDGDGSDLIARYPEPGGRRADNLYAVYLATQCTDARWPSSYRRIRRDNSRVAAEAPFLTWSNAQFNGPCRTWPGRSRSRFDVDGRAVRTPILLLSETYDAATPYSGSLRVRRLFPSARLVEGAGGTTHSSSLSGMRCTDRTIGRYLETGEVPRRRSGNRADKRCAPVPVPETLDEQRRVLATTSPAADLVRRTLEEARPPQVR